MWSGGRVRLAALGLAAAVACLGVTGVLGASAAAPASAAPRAATGHSHASIVLDDQSEWVVPPASGAAATFDLDLSARGAPAGATVETILYPRLDTRDGFKSAVKNGPHGYPLSHTVPVAYAGLPAAPRGVGGVQLGVSVVPVGWTDSGTRIGLDCAPPTGTGACTGVYPVEVELLRASGTVLAHFTTFLTYVAGKSAHPLDVAWVVPLASPVHIDTTTTKPSTALEPPSRSDASALEALVAQLAAASSVPVTVDASGETLQALTRSGSAGRAADATLASMSADQTRAEVLAAPYVPVDLGALAGAGEPTEITGQMSAGRTVLRKLGITTSTSATWVTTDPAGSDLLKGLREAHERSLVVPDTDLAPTQTPTAGTWTSTFRLELDPTTATATSVPAAETDTWLDSQFEADPGDPGLAASQMLADLAMVHFERPNTRALRGMIALPPAGWAPNATFDRVLLAGLSANPDVDPVTLATFLSHVTANGTRQTKTGGRGPVLSHATALKLSTARVRLTDFDSAIDGTAPVESDLDDLLLATETDGLSRRARAAAIGDFNRVFAGQIDLVTVDKDSFTLTARTGWIPVTIDSGATYTLIGTVSVSGNKFVFPRRSSKSTFHLAHPTNSWRVDVRARSSGDLPLHVTFTTPQGDLVLASRTLTVRSTATSVVGIVLTVAALVILFAWWARTWFTGTRRKRGLARNGAGE